MRGVAHKAWFRVFILLLFIGAVMAGLWLFRPEAASYEGKSARFWLGHLPMTILTSGPSRVQFYPADVNFQGRPAATPSQKVSALRARALEAVRAMGTNALPQIMEELVAQESPLGKRF